MSVTVNVMSYFVTVLMSHLLCADSENTNICDYHATVRKRNSVGNQDGTKSSKFTHYTLKIIGCRLKVTTKLHMLEEFTVDPDSSSSDGSFTKEKQHLFL